MLGCDETGCDVKIVETQSADCVPCLFNATAGGRRRAQLRDDILLSGNISFSVESIPLNKTLIQERLDEVLEDTNNDLALNGTLFRFLTIFTTQAPTSPIPTFWPTCRYVIGCVSLAPFLCECSTLLF